MFYGNLAQLGKKLNSVIRSRPVMVKNWCYVLSMEGVTVCGHHPECRVIFLDISLPEKLIGKSHRPQNKTFIRGASPGVSDKL